MQLEAYPTPKVRRIHRKRKCQYGIYVLPTQIKKFADDSGQPPTNLPRNMIHVTKKDLYSGKS